MERFKLRVLGGYFCEKRPFAGDAIFFHAFVVSLYFFYIFIDFHILYGLKKHIKIKIQTL